MHINTSLKMCGEARDGCDNRLKSLKAHERMLNLAKDIRGIAPKQEEV